MFDFVCSVLFFSRFLSSTSCHDSLLIHGFVLSFCNPVLLELFLCMHHQTPAIVSQLLRLFRGSLVIYHLLRNVSENCTLMAGCCNLIISNFFLIALLFCFLFSFSLIFYRKNWWSLTMTAPLMAIVSITDVRCCLLTNSWSI